MSNKKNTIVAHKNILVWKMSLSLGPILELDLDLELELELYLDPELELYGFFN